MTDSIFHLQTRYRQYLADTLTPVSLYLRLRDHFEQPILLESSDYHGNENPFSFICFSPVASVRAARSRVQADFPDGSRAARTLTSPQELPELLGQFLAAFRTEELPFPFIWNGLFGYHAYDAVRYYETVDIQPYQTPDREIPDLYYAVYRHMIVINHFNNEMYLFEHSTAGMPSSLDRIESLMFNQSLPQYPFSIRGEERSTLSDAAYLELVETGKRHCRRGDVFQIVLSRQFQQAFDGDEFNVYRCLRAINPSPYLFYCDYGDFKLMGSSPEAQLVIQDGQAGIHPIAGTFRRTGHDAEDSALAARLLDDPKESAEHVMLVDLARNDLSRHGDSVQVETFKEVQYYSHVIHLVSRVTARIGAEASPLQLVADTFPAGTLSGAPKHRAMQLIDLYEPQNRGFYGGCIGYLGFNGNFNHAIMIRSLMSKGNILYFQAGAGIVERSDPQAELQEVHNKVAALRQAIQLAARMALPATESIR